MTGGYQVRIWKRRRAGRVPVRREDPEVRVDNAVVFTWLATV